MANYEKALRSISGLRTLLRLYPTATDHGAFIRALGASSHWRLGEGSGNALDSIGSVEGTLVGAPSRNAYCRAATGTDGAISFNGTNNALTFPEAYRFEGRAPFTIAGWIYANAQQASNHFMAKDTGSEGWGIQFQGASASTLGFVFFRRGGGVASVCNSAANLSTLTWYHFAATYDGDEMRLYVNGLLSSHANNPKASTQATGTNAATLTMGRTSGGGQWANVRLDDVGVWERALRDHEVWELYVNGNLPHRDTGPMASAIGIARNLQNSLMSPSPDIPGSTRFAADAPLLGGGIFLPDVPEYDFLGNAPFTFSWWQWLDSILPVGQYGRVLSKESAGTMIRVLVGNGSTQQSLGRIVSGVQTAYGSAPPNSTKVQEWQHFACTYDGATLTMYADGIPGTPTSATASFPDINVPMWIGNYRDDGGQWLPGNLSMWAYHNRAMTAQEVATLSASRTGMADPAGRGLVLRGAGGQRTSVRLPYQQGVSGKSIATPFVQDGPKATKSWVLPFIQHGDAARSYDLPYRQGGQVVRDVELPFATLDATTGVDQWGGIVAPLMGWRDPEVAKAGLHEAMRSSPGILSIYRLGETSGGFPDALGIGPDGAVGNTLTRGVRGALPGDPDAAVWSANTGYVAVTDYAPHRFDGYSPCAVVGLFRLDGNGGTHPTLVSKGGSDGWNLYDFSRTTSMWGRGTTYAGTVRAMKPTAYWRLGEASGQALDSIGTLHGTIAGGVVRDVAGPLASGDDGAVDFDGTSGVITVGDYLDFINRYPFTINLWVNPDALVTSARLVSKITGSNGYDILLPNTSGGIRFARGNGTTNDTIDGTGMVAGQWQMVTAVYDGTYLRLYRNGAANATPVQSTGSNVDNTQVLQFGRQSNTSTGWYDGKMDEVAIWSRALSASEVARLYAAGTSIYGGTVWTGGPALTPDGRWHMVGHSFDGAYGKTWVDGVAGALSADQRWVVLEGIAGPSLYIGNGLHGAADEVGLWNRALSDAEMVALFNIWKGTATSMPAAPTQYRDVVLATPGVLSYWTLSQQPQSGNAGSYYAVDECGLSTVVFPARAALGQEPLKPKDPAGRSLMTDPGSGLYPLWSAAGAPLDLTQYGSFSIECWLQPILAGYGFFNISSKGTSWLLRIDISGEGKNITWFVGHGNVMEPRLDTGPTVVDGNTYHVVAAYERDAADAGGTLLLYINGTLSGSMYRSGARSPTSTANSCLTGDATLASDLAFYSRALTAAEVAAHYAAGV